MGETRKGGARPGAGRKPAKPSVVIRLPLDVATIAKRVAEGALQGGDISAFYQVDYNAPPRLVPLMSASAECGFPSPAEDYIEGPLNFDELLIDNAPATFVVRVKGESMTGVGIFPGDYVIVDRAKTARSGNIIMACLDQKFTIKRYKKTARGWLLKAENPAYADTLITEQHEFSVWGVITRAIRML